jgi:putative hydrolase of the HAD superfamily
VRGVIFDLWDTIVEWPADEARRLLSGLPALVGVGDEEFGRRWAAGYRASQTGPLADAYRSLGLPEEHVPGQIAAHHEFARRALHPRPGATAVLAALRARGIRVGLLSNCSEEVPATWAETELAGCFDVEMFSSACGLMKPDPGIYLRTARALGVEPGECFFVGDGANDELAGAARVGMTPVLFVPGGRPPLWENLTSWDGLTVTSMEEVLELC